MAELKPNPKAVKRSRRVARGIGSGWGKTAGRGSKGQKSRSGGSIPSWFEGGQQPLYRRIPKRGFTNIHSKKISTVSILYLINLVSSLPDEVTEDVLVKLRLAPKGVPIKLIGATDADLKVLQGKTIKVFKLTKQLSEKLLENGVFVSET